MNRSTRGFYSLHDWVIMPSHVRAVFESKSALPAIMRWLKGRVKAGLVDIKERWPWSSVGRKAD